MKKLIVLFFSLGFLTVVPSSVHAISGACSGHQGVNMYAGADTDGSVICNDGWTASNVLYRDMGSNIRTGYPSYRYKTGTVAWSDYSCDYYVISVGYWYTVAEWYGGKIPSEGDIITGELNSYSFKDLYIGNRKSRAYIEDYMVNAERAVEILQDKCNL